VRPVGVPDDISGEDVDTAIARVRTGQGTWSSRAGWLLPITGAVRLGEVMYTFLYRRCRMKTMSYTESRARYAEVLDAVVNDREEVVITRAGHDPVVILSLADYESLRETAYLMRSPANARRLLDAMERLEDGRGEQHDLVGTETEAD